MGRTGDVINVTDHRLSTGKMNEVWARHPVVAECAVTPVRPTIEDPAALTGARPLAQVADEE